MLTIQITLCRKDFLILLPVAAVLFCVAPIARDKIDGLVSGWGNTNIPEIETPETVSVGEEIAAFPPHSAGIGIVTVTGITPATNSQSQYTIRTSDNEERIAYASATDIKVGDSVEATVFVYYDNGQPKHTYRIRKDPAIAKAGGLDR